MKCPKCGSTEQRRSRHSEWKDIFHKVLGQQAQRCRSCHTRFYAPPPPPEPAPASTNGSRKRHHKSRGNFKRLRRHIIEAAVFAAMLVIFLLCLLFITSEHKAPPDASFLSGSLLADSGLGNESL